MFTSSKNRKKIFTLLVFLIVFGFFECPVTGLDKQVKVLSLSSDTWKVLTDSGWPGASSGYIESLSDNKCGVKFNYNLKATKLWPWPEIDLLMEFDKPKDLREFKGVRLDIKGKSREEAYFYFLVRDNNIRILKPVYHRVILTDRYQKVSLAFSEFEIAKDWTPRNPGFNPVIEWDRVEAVGLHKKGRDKEKGSIFLLDIEFLQNLPQKISRPEMIRSLPPEHFFIEPMDQAIKKPDAKILIYGEGVSPYLSLGKQVRGLSLNGERAKRSPQRGKVRMKGKISPYLYGANWGVWLDFPDKQKINGLPIKILRAGGPFMDRYNWHSSKYTFPGNEKPLLMKSLDDFVQYCHSIGAEPLIQINALGYAPDYKDKDKFKRCIGPNDAVELIRYLNEEKGYNVKFFEIGNEPFIWHKVHFDVTERPCSIKEYFEIFKETSVAMKKAQAEINPTLQIKIFGPAISTSWLNWKTLSQEDFGHNPVEYFLKRCREYQDNKIENPAGFRILDVLSFHLFADFKNPQTAEVETDILDILSSTQTWWSKSYVNRHDRSLPQGVVCEVIPKFKSWIQKHYPGTELAVTEFNIDSQSMVDYEPIIKVLYLADLYGIMAKYGVDYATQFCLNSSDHNAALIDDTDNITPLYYPMALYAKYFKGVILDSETSLPERLNVYVCNNGESLVMMAINKDKRPYLAEVILKNQGKKQKDVRFYHNFSPLSLTCMRIPRVEKDKLVEYWEYGRRQI